MPYLIFPGSTMDKLGTGGEMFLAGRPQGLQDYFYNYELEGDLLRALHTTQEKGGHFLFRDRSSARDPDIYVIICVNKVLTYIK